jgi:hypothetical protein
MPIGLVNRTTRSGKMWRFLILAGCRKSTLWGRKADFAGKADVFTHSEQATKAEEVAGEFCAEALFWG